MTSSDASNLTPFMQEVWNLYAAFGHNGDSHELQSKIKELYTEDIHAITPVNERRGREHFSQSWIEMRDEFSQRHFELKSAVGLDEHFVFFMNMTLKVPLGPKVTIPISTEFRTKKDGDHPKIYYQRDYWDTLGGLLRGWPAVDHFYKRAADALLGGRAYGYQLNRAEPKGCCCPRTEAELIAVVKAAYDSARTGKPATVRAIGTGHSVWESIVPDGFPKQPSSGNTTLVVLHHLRGIAIAKEQSVPGSVLVDVEAGCNLGRTRERPEPRVMSPEVSDLGAYPNVTFDHPWDESLCDWLQRNGLALPNLGGISQQTVGGFISTGSSGGSCKYSFADAIEKIRLIDGTGKVRELSRGDEDPEAAGLFAAAGVGLGLCGIISRVTFRCEKAYNVTATQTVSKTCKAKDVDFYGEGKDGRPSLHRFLKEKDYSRLLWWPQADFDRLSVWYGTRVGPNDTRKAPSTTEFGPSIQVQLAGAILFTLVGNLTSFGTENTKQTRAQLLAAVSRLGRALSPMVADKTNPGPYQPSYGTPGGDTPASGPGQGDDATHNARPLVDAFDKVVVEGLKLLLESPSGRWVQRFAQLLEPQLPKVLPALLNQVVPLAKPQSLEDVWYKVLPTDDRIDDMLLPVYFTELWIPVTEGGDEVNKTIRALKSMFHKKSEGRSYRATGPFTVEIYAAKREECFLMSPAYGHDWVLRIDVFWFGGNPVDPRDSFYPEFWHALEHLHYKLHWGKFLPKPSQLAPEVLLSRFSGWGEFKQALTTLDPHGLFRTKYWTDQLALATVHRGV